VKPLSTADFDILEAFISFCNGQYDTGKKSRPLRSGSGMGRAHLHDAFGSASTESRASVLKAVRRGFLKDEGGSWFSPTELGREATREKIAAANKSANNMEGDHGKTE